MSAETTSVHLLIPMHVDALVVPQKDVRFGFVSAAPRYTRMATEYPTRDDLRTVEKNSLQPGIHLHFRLPMPLAHASAAGVFPRIPNRWLVQRYHRTGESLSARAWLVMSDAESTGTPPGVVLPFFRGGKAEADAPLILRPTGTAKALDERERWKEERDTPAQVELTAVSGGDAGFSAHYPACRSMLGFHDALADLGDLPEEARFSFLVCGWYSGKGDDPWSGLLAESVKVAEIPREWKGLSAHARKEIDRWLAERRCSITHAPGDPLPDRVLCHGVVTDVRWRRGLPIPIDPDPFQDFEKPPQYWVDLGNNSAEAFGSRVSELRKTAPRDLQEDLVCAFQSGLLSEGADFPKLDAELHRLDFAPADGGQTWGIQAEAGPVLPGATPTPPPPVPDRLQQMLEDLNRKEQVLDPHSRWFRDFRWELYAVWRRYVEARKTRDNVRANLLTDSLAALKPFIAAYRSKVAEMQRGRDKAQHDLDRELKKLPGDGSPQQRYTLVQQPSQPFYAPNDPVLLLAGPAMQSLGSVPRSEEPVKCRRTGETLMSFTCSEKDGRAEVVVGIHSLLQDLKLSAKYLDSIPVWGSQLLGEALLQDEMARRKVSPIYLPETVLPKDGSIPDESARFGWKHNPWIPVYISWRVEWHDEYSQKQLSEKWTLDAAVRQFGRNTDLVPAAPGASPAAPKPLEISGLSFPGTPLGGLQMTRFEGKAKELLSAINARLQSRMTVMMSVGLAGFHDALLMRRAGDQLAPLDYNRWKDEKGNPYYLDNVGSYLGSDFHPDSSPRIDGPFHPIRMGSIRVKSIRVIDAFGQFLDVPIDRLTPGSFSRAGRLVPSAAASGVPPLLTLVPRACRPMRLEFTGIPAGGPLAGAPPSSPVCGWIVLNHFEQHLALYAANGRPAGILQRVFDSRDTAHLFYPVPIPGMSADQARIENIANPFLRDFAEFVLSLNQDEGAAFAALVDGAVEATEQRTLQENAAVSVLIGRPLVLVRASLRLTMDGLPALDQSKSWLPSSGPSPLTKMLESVLTGDRLELPNEFMVTGGVSDVRWKVRLGERRGRSDGLVGFFKGALGSRPFYAARGFTFPNIQAGRLQSMQDLELDGRQALEVTLLMDPQASVHATTGILPRVSFQLPSSELAASRQIREIFFQTAPVLGEPDAPHVPRPSDDYGQWSWAFRPKVTMWSENPELISASDRARLPIGWPTIAEGWLKLKIEPVRIGGLWLKSPGPKPKRNSTVTIAWSVQGADALKLYRGGLQVGSWEAPLAHEWHGEIFSDTTFELRASDKTGYTDVRQISIQVEE